MLGIGVAFIILIVTLGEHFPATVLPLIVLLLSMAVALDKQSMTSARPFLKVEASYPLSDDGKGKLMRTLITNISRIEVKNIEISTIPGSIAIVFPLLPPGCPIECPIAEFGALNSNSLVLTIFYQSVLGKQYRDKYEIGLILDAEKANKTIHIPKMKDEPSTQDSEAVCVKESHIR